MAKRSLSQLDINGSRVLVRVDFNVPIEQGIEAIAGYDQRLRATLPTIRHLIDRDAVRYFALTLDVPEGRWTMRCALSRWATALPSCWATL